MFSIDISLVLTRSKYIPNHYKSEFSLLSGYMFQEPPLDYVCDVCSKTFYHPESFAGHKKFHKGETTCPHCKHPFSTVGTLNRHIRKVHKTEPYSISNEDVLDYSKTQPILYNTLKNT